MFFTVKMSYGLFSISSHQENPYYLNFLEVLSSESTESISPSLSSFTRISAASSPIFPYYLFFFIEIYDCIHTIFIFQHEKQNEKYTFIPFISRVYCLKWTIKRSNFYEGLTLCRFKYNFDRLERDKSKFDWRKYKIHLDEYVCLPDWESKICRPVRKTNIFVIIGQTFDVQKYAQNHVNSL